MSKKASKKSTFSNCASLQCINILNTIKVLKDKAFFGCEVLMVATLGDGLEEIEARAFSDCR